MNPTRQDEQVIRAWLASDALFELDELVLDAVFARSRRTRQHRRPLGWRRSSMNRSYAFATGAVAIVIVILSMVVLLKPGTPSVGNASILPLTSVGPSTPTAGSAGPSAAPASAAAAASPSRPAGPWLSLAIVNRDGTVRQDLGLPSDAWMADLSSDGRSLAFLTRSPAVGFCGGCGAGAQRLAILRVGSSEGAFVYPQFGGTTAAPSPGGDVNSIEEPAWSPDGTRLAFTARDGTGNEDIYVLTVQANGDIIGGAATRLTSDPAVDEFPAWTPDGRTILYDNMGSEPGDPSGFSNTQEIWSVPAAGGTPRRLTTNDVPDAMPDVSAGGTVAFWHGGEIWTMDLEGRRQTRVDGAPDLFNPRWSPDGKTIAVLRYDASARAVLPEALGLPTDLPTMNVVLLDVTHHQLSAVGPNVAADFNPVSWTPDGSGLLVDRYMTGP